MPNSAVFPWTLILQGGNQDYVCTGLLGRCPGCPHQGTWWAISSLRPDNCFRVSQVSLSLHTRYGIHQHTTSHENSFWLFWQGLSSISPATCLSALCKYHNPYGMGFYLFFSPIHTDGFGAMCCNCLWRLMFRKGNRAMEISLRTTQKEILLSTLWYHQFDCSYLRHCYEYWTQRQVSHSFIFHAEVCWCCLGGLG